MHPIHLKIVFANFAAVDVLYYVKYLNTKVLMLVRNTQFSRLINLELNEDRTNVYGLLR